MQSHFDTRTSFLVELRMEKRYSKRERKLNEILRRKKLVFFCIFNRNFREKSTTKLFQSFKWQFLHFIWRNFKQKNILIQRVWIKLNHLKMRRRLKLTSKSNGKVQKTWNFFAEFCDHSTIHGVRYITERQRHWTERSVNLFLFSNFRFYIEKCQR